MKKFLRFICFLLVVSTVMFGLNFALSTNSDKDGIHIRGYFKEPKNTVDVLLIGASELYTGFNSPLAWEKYGFTSYGLSFAAMPGALYKTVTQKALKTQSPKLVVFEINGFLHKEKNSLQRRPIHAWFDTVGIDSDGKKFLEQNIPEREHIEYYLPFYKYHANWREPLICARNAMSRLTLEIEGISYSKAFANTALKRKDAKLKKRKNEFSDKSKGYLLELLNYCRDEKMKNVLFIRAPHCIKNENPKATNDIKKLIESYGYRFVDFEKVYDAIGLDPQNDFYNHDHLNIYGMEKFTAFFGKYICDNYNVKTAHTTETVEQWNKCADIMNRTIEECKNDPNQSIYYELTAYETAKGRKHTILSKVESGFKKNKHSR